MKTAHGNYRYIYTWSYSELWTDLGWVLTCFVFRRRMLTLRRFACLMRSRWFPLMRRSWWGMHIHVHVWYIYMYMYGSCSCTCMVYTCTCKCMVYTCTCTCMVCTCYCTCTRTCTYMVHVHVWYIHVTVHVPIWYMLLYMYIYLPPPPLSIPVCSSTSSCQFQAHQRLSSLQRGKPIAPLPIRGPELASLQLVHSAKLHTGWRDGIGQDCPVNCAANGSDGEKGKPLNVC